MSGVSIGQTLRVVKLESMWFGNNKRKLYRGENLYETILHKV